jgi:hypothetical protein
MDNTVGGTTSEALVAIAVSATGSSYADDLLVPS